MKTLPQCIAWMQTQTCAQLQTLSGGRFAFRVRGKLTLPTGETRCFGYYKTFYGDTATEAISKAMEDV